MTYVVLSVREVFLYRASLSGQGAATRTEPEPLLKGIEPPSRRALEYLLLATLPQSLVSHLHKLPAEVQDLILVHISAGPVEAARIGCQLALGSAFTWKSNDCVIKRQEVLNNKPQEFPVESEIWFGGCMSGLVYK